MPFLEMEQSRMLRRTARVTVFVLLAFLVATVGPATAATPGADEIRDAIRQRVEHLRQAQRLEINGARIAAVRFVPALYGQREFRPLWTDAGHIDALFGEIVRSKEHGLDPDDFHDRELQQMRQRLGGGGAVKAGDFADFDILLTDSLARLGYQLFWGKVDPEQLDASWNFQRPLLDTDPVALVERSFEAGQVGALLRSLELDHPVYQRLKAGLAGYRALQDSGGWLDLPEGPALKPGMRESRVSALRRRLEAEGMATGSPPSDPQVYDPALTAAVESFQARYGLEQDAVVGKQTLAELNVPIEARIEQIRVNLERARWILRNLGGDFVVVNIAGFRTYLVRGGEVVWQARSIVGRPYRKTPVFRDQISYLEINPTWTVPPGILRKDILPKARKDPSYLRRQNFRVVDGNGRSVDPASLDWANLSARGFPYQIVQQPGPENALGLVKFMFPNKYLVYLHDTPSRALFERSERTFSSGCIRVETPFDLAERLLAGDPGWNRERIDALVASGKTQRVNLPAPLPVLLLYWTVETDGDVIRFRRDIYERDGSILKALNADFVPAPPGATSQ